MEAPIEKYPVVVEIPVAWGEMDAFLHVNNIYFFRYFETARIAFFERMGIPYERTDEGPGVILANTSCQFLKPLYYPDRLKVGARVRSTGKTSIVLEYVVVDSTGERTAVGDSVVVLYHYGRGEKMPVPEDLRKRIENLEG